jgi:hypothetical protein
MILKTTSIFCHVLTVPLNDGVASEPRFLCVVHSILVGSERVVAWMDRMLGLAELIAHCTLEVERVGFRDASNGDDAVSVLDTCPVLTGLLYIESCFFSFSFSVQRFV